MTTLITVFLILLITCVAIYTTAAVYLFINKTNNKYYKIINNIFHVSGIIMCVIVTLFCVLVGIKMLK